MDDLTLLFPDVGDGGAPQGAVVGVLAAALRVEGGAVQRDGKALLVRGAGEDPGGELHQKRVLVE